MNLRANFCLLLFVLASSLRAEEQWHFSTDKEDKPRLTYQDHQTRSSFMSYYLKYDHVSNEVIEQFKTKYPKLWKDALSSSGNTHNPKVQPLRRKFKECLLATPTLRKLDAISRESGWTIHQISYEKFHLQKEGDTVRVRAVVWLEFKRIKNSPNENSP